MAQPQSAYVVHLKGTESFLELDIYFAESVPTSDDPGDDLLLCSSPQQAMRRITLTRHSVDTDDPAQVARMEELLRVETSQTYSVRVCSERADVLSYLQDRMEKFGMDARTISMYVELFRDQLL